MLLRLFQPVRQKCQGYCSGFARRTAGFAGKPRSLICNKAAIQCVRCFIPRNILWYLRLGFATEHEITVTEVLVPRCARVCHSGRCSIQQTDSTKRAIGTDVPHAQRTFSACVLGYWQALCSSRQILPQAASMNSEIPRESAAVRGRPGIPFLGC